MDLSTLTIEQLKVYAFDQIIARDRAISNLNALIEEMNKREQPQESETATE